MTNGKHDKVLNSISAGGHPIYQFIEYNEYCIKLEHIEEKEQYVIIDKQSLLAFANIFSELAKKFTILSPQ